MTTTTDRPFLAEADNGGLILCAGPEAVLMRACGCVPADTSRRCLTARKLRVLVNGAALDFGTGSVEHHNALLALNAHLNGEDQ